MANSIEGADRCKCRCAGANGYHNGTRRRTGIDGSSGWLVKSRRGLSIFRSLKLAVAAIFDRRISSSALSGTPEIASTHVHHRNRLQSRAEFWMIAAHDTTSSRSSHRSAGEDSRKKWSRATRIENCACAVASSSCSRFPAGSAHVAHGARVRLAYGADAKQSRFTRRDSRTRWRLHEMCASRLLADANRVRRRQSGRRFDVHR